MWTFYSIGDSHFLSAVINAVAMVFNSHVPDSLAAIGLVLGVLYQGYKGTVDTNGISFGQLLSVFILYLLFFVPKTSINIEDVYTAESRVVDHVPLGVAAAGSIISTVGYSVANVMTTAFAKPTASDKGFLSALSLLANLRGDLAMLAKLKYINESGNGNFKESWLNYFKECTLIGVDSGKLNIDEIYRAENLLQSVRFDSNLYGTAINVGTGMNNLTCTQAYQQLLTYTNTTFKQALSNELKNDPSNVNAVVEYNSLNSDGINEALTALGIANTSAQDYVLSVLLLPIYEEAANQKYISEQAYTSALMLNDAISARNTQWAAEQGMFFTVVRPMLTFFEALVFAISPFMAFVVVLGLGGVTMLGRYLVILVWIELWQPLLCLINLYIAEAASGTFAATGIEPNSLLGIMTLNKITAEYLSVGGMLAAAVPGLALMVVYGGSVAATSLASRLGGQDHINETIANPSIAKNSPVLENSPAFSGSTLSSISRTGSSGYLPELSLQTGFDRAVRSAKANVESTESVFSKNLAKTQAHTLSQSVTSSTLQQNGRRISTSETQSAAFINSSAKQIAQRVGLDSKQEDGLRGALSAMLNGSSLGSSNLANLALSGTVASSDSVIIGKVASELENISKDEGLRSDYSRSLSNELANGITESIGDTSNTGNTSALMQSAREANSAREELSDLFGRSNTLVAGNRIDGLAISRGIVQKPGLLNKLENYANIRSDVSARANELMPMMNSLIPDAKQAFAASMLTAMVEKDPQNAFQYMLEATGLAQSDLKHPNLDKPNTDFNTNIVPPFTNKHSANVVDEHIASSFSNSRASINKKYEQANDSSSVGNNYAEILSKPLGMQLLLAGGGQSISSDRAETIAKDKGLNEAQTKVFVAFSQGIAPNDDDLAAIQDECGDKSIYDGIVNRLQLGATNGNVGILEPIGGYNRSHKKQN